MNIWILQTGEPLPTDAGSPRAMRAMNAASALVAQGHNVVLWSSDFYHQEKRHRFGRSVRIRVDDHLEVRLLKSPGYRRNIGLGRLWDHACLGHELAAQLEVEQHLPDVVLIGFPPIETAAVMTRWLQERKIPSLLDVKDQWPSIFLEPLPRWLRHVGRFALTPYFTMTKGAMRNATAIGAMANGMLSWALSFSGRERRQSDAIIPLTSSIPELSPLQLAEAEAWWDSRGVMDDSRPRICFVGSHTRSFDFDTVADAAKVFTKRNEESRPLFIIAGDGDRSAAWQARAAELPNVIFPGWIDQAKLAVLASRCKVFIAPYKETGNFEQNIPNKIVDALSHGLPILTPLAGEVARLIEDSAVGVRYRPRNAGSLIEAVDKVLADETQRLAMANRCRELYSSRFTYESVYGGLVRRLEELASYGRNSEQ